MDWFKKYWIYIVLWVFTINILLLDLFSFFPKSQLSPADLSKNTNLPNTSGNYCPQNCLNQIDLALKSQGASISSAAKTTSIVTQSPISSVSPTPASVTTSNPSPTPMPVKNVKEFFVPLGAGTGKAADWTTVDGIGAKIDLSDYGDIKQVTFEASAFVPTGNQTIWIRLYNANTYQSVADSEVTLSGGTATLLISSPITLASGNNLYQVQMKTQLQAVTNIIMARLRIKTN